VFIGGKMKNKHADIRLKAHLTTTSHSENKTAVMGMLQRGKDIRMTVIPDNKSLKSLVYENVSYKAMVITDSHIAYVGLDKKYAIHSSVDHKADEYVRGGIYTNGIEGAFGLFKRMVLGIYHQITPKHLERYLDEFTLPL
jgi:hypothetical protein